MNGENSNLCGSFCVQPDAEPFIIRVLNLCMLFHELFRCVTYSSFVQKLARASPELALIGFHTHRPYNSMPL
ncbi:hypothetical protein BDA96_04G040100 [Sorghum bicolor]|jgi:hypothetical protein|uniref:Uncharacterized protein n=2 Tax=Sorghum bicolor TaxID=4558 RepID=A0A921UJ27_SORBI|nr:hypothetical protein BDA96_04G040100 [Sorghum bicolor]KXG29434.1 hypothetical protein SORBI_3004G035700 [Sorghum bicolor]